MPSSYVGLYDDAGSRNTFFRIVGNKRLGFKCFQDKDNADFAHRIQSGLADMAMAPKVYGDVGRIRYAGELTEWGYLTEVAKPMAECYDEEYCDGECFDSECSNSINIQSVVWTLEKYHGLSYVDAHRANFGWIKRKSGNILVPIDFGVESFGFVDEEIWGAIDWDCLTEHSCNCTACRYESI
jgi:hypothetical protein